MKVLSITLIAVSFICSSFIGLAQSFSGYALYNSQNSSTSYLIDENGDIAHSWSCNVNGNYAVLLKEDGNIVRGGKYSGNILSGAAVGGMLQEYDPSANVVWEFIYSTSQHVQHHDIEIMPNGNVLFIAWEVKSTSELTQAGYDGAMSEKWPSHIVEIQPSGSTASIVWEWHIWDHMIQDFDAGKDNYGVIADHPELMDINAISSGGPGPGGGDWFHVNGINYNETLDQIVFTSRHASELYIIDHSTSTAEAASHAGGNSGMGGDFIYRWGNPSNYGASGSQIITAACHDPRWIKDDGRINGGFIQFFNNEGDGGNSAVDAIDAPVDGYNYTLASGQAYGPSTYSWRHNCVTNANGQSASDKLSNGNTFVNLSGEYMYEVDSNDNIVWQYNDGPAKAFRYECDHAGAEILMSLDCNCDPSGTAYEDSCGDCVGGNTGLTECTSNLSVTTSATDASSGTCDATATASATLGVSPYTYSWNTSPAQATVTATGLCGSTSYTVLVTDANGDTVSTSVTIVELTPTGIEETINSAIVVYPNPSNGKFELHGIVSSGDYTVRVLDMYGALISISDNVTSIDLSDEAAGLYFIQIDLPEGVGSRETITKMISLIK